LIWVVEEARIRIYVTSVAIVCIHVAPRCHAESGIRNGDEAIGLARVGHIKTHAMRLELLLSQQVSRGLFRQPSASLFTTEGHPRVIRGASANAEC